MDRKIARRSLDLSDLDAVMNDAESLLANGYDKAGHWDVAPVQRLHCTFLSTLLFAMALTTSVSGDPSSRSEVDLLNLRQWNDYTIRAAGDTVTLTLNGREVNRATGCDVAAGPILLTAEGSAIHFRKIRLIAKEKD